MTPAPHVGPTNPMPTFTGSSLAVAAAPLLASAQAAAATATATANQALAATRAVTAPVPVQIVTADYAAAPSDQRFDHLDAAPHTLTLQPAAAVYERAFLVLNDGDGDLTVVDADGSVLVVLTAGMAAQVVAYFRPGAGDEVAPADLQVNGVPSTATGAHAWRVYNRMAPLNAFGDMQAALAEQATAIAVLRQQAASLQQQVQQLTETIVYQTTGTYRGTWTSGATYVFGDTVVCNGSSYKSLAPNSNSTPAVDNSNANWGLIAQQGATGSAGSAGATGAQGAAASVAPGSFTTAQGTMPSPAAGTFEYVVEYVGTTNIADKLCPRQTGLAAVVVKNDAPLTTTYTLTVSPPTGSQFDRGQKASIVLNPGDSYRFSADPADSTSWMLG